MFLLETVVGGKWVACTRDDGDLVRFDTVPEAEGEARFSLDAGAMWRVIPEGASTFQGDARAEEAALVAVLAQIEDLSDDAKRRVLRAAAALWGER